MRITFNIPSPGLCGNSEILAYRWRPGGDDLDYGVKFVDGTAHFVSEFAGYYAFALSGDDATDLNVTMKVDWNNSYLRADDDVVVSSVSNDLLIQPLPEIINNQHAVHAIRINGIAGLVSPIAPALVQSGTIVAVQTPKNTNLLSYFGAIGGNGDVFNALTALKGSKTFKADVGAYGFSIPTTDSLNMNQLMVELNNNYSGLHKLSPVCADGILFFAVSTPLSSTGVYGGNHFKFSPTFNIEYNTDSQMHETRIPRISTAEVEEALAELAAIPQFYENPLHLKDISKFLLAIARSLGKNVPGFLTAFGHPGLAAVVKPFSDLL
jgi:hypothetical protein